MAPVGLILYKFSHNIHTYFLLKTVRRPPDRARTRHRPENTSPVAMLEVRTACAPLRRRGPPAEK